jgi:hypothetical protein
VCVCVCVLFAATCARDLLLASRHCLCGWAGVCKVLPCSAHGLAGVLAFFAARPHRDGCRAAIPQTGPCVSSRVVRASGLFGCLVVFLADRRKQCSSCFLAGFSTVPASGWAGIFLAGHARRRVDSKCSSQRKKTETRSEWVVWLFDLRIAASSAPRVFSLGFPQFLPAGGLVFSLQVMPDGGWTQNALRREKKTETRCHLGGPGFFCIGQGEGECHRRFLFVLLRSCLG